MRGWRVDEIELIYMVCKRVVPNRYEDSDIYGEGTIQRYVELLNCIPMEYEV